MTRVNGAVVIAGNASLNKHIIFYC